MEMPSPTAAHKQLDRLIGTWVGEETISPSPFDPQGGTATARVVNRGGLAGFVVIHDYEQRRGGAVSLSGHGVFSWDAAQQCHVMHWFDSMGGPPLRLTGQFAGDTLTLSNFDGEMYTQVSFDVGQPNGYRFKMEVSQDGASWSPFMEGSYGPEPASAAKKKAAGKPTKRVTKATLKPAKPTKKAPAKKAPAKKAPAKKAPKKSVGTKRKAAKKRR